MPRALEGEHSRAMPAAWHDPETVSFRILHEHRASLVSFVPRWVSSLLRRLWICTRCGSLRR
eukprot:4334128-Pyramimonas_sp.AAC.1